MPRRILVTGAAGRIGRATLDLLATQGIAATALVLEDPGDLKVSAVVVGDARDVEVVDVALDGTDGVIHLAAIPTPLRHPPAEVFATNTQSTFTVLDRAGALGIRRVAMASSLSIIGLPFASGEAHPAYLPIDEHLPCEVEDPYGLSKQVDELTAAAIARRYGMSIVALRFPYVGGWDDRLPEHAAALTADPSLGARELWSYVETRDAARAALLALSVDRPGVHVVNVAAPETLVPFPTENLLRRFHPDSELRSPLPGRASPIDSSAAHTLLDWHAEAGTG